MQIIENKALLINAPDPSVITDNIHKSAQVSEGVLVKWGHTEAEILAKLGFADAPSPMLKSYEWTGKLTPFEHQKTTASFLSIRRRAFCFNEQGTGKTASVIWAADYLMKAGLVKRVLVLCPLSIMKSAWQQDLFKFAMHRSCSVAHGSAKQREKIIDAGAEFVIINFDGLAIVKDQIMAGGFDLIVVDEANAYKNAQTNRWKVLKQIVKETDPRLWMLTGTPAAQSPLDAYGLAKLVESPKCPKYYGQYRDQVMMKVTQFKWVPKPSALDTVFNSLQPAIRFTKEECLDLPEMTYVNREVTLTKQQQKFYTLMKNRMVMEAAGEEITAVNAAVNLSKLLQISCGAVYSDTGEVVEFDIKNRYAVLKEVIEESNNKVLVFVPFKHAIDLISAKFAEDGISAEIIRGDVPVNRRTDIFKRFQETPEPKVLIIQPQSAAHGVTLTAADTVVWWGPTSSLETYAQANARVHRAGQRHPSVVIRLQGSNAEKHVYKMLDNKNDIHTKIVDLYKELLD